MKKLNFLSGFIAGAVLFGSISVVSAKTEKIEALFDNIKIKINGKIIDTGEDKPFIYAGRTYLPVRYVAEAFNSTVKWVETDNTVEIDSVASPSAAPQSNTVTPPVGRDQGLQKDLKTPDGLNIYNALGLGIMLSDVLAKYSDITYEQKTNRISYKNEELKTVYVYGFKGTSYIIYDDYVDKVLPILQK